VNVREPLVRLHERPGLAQFDLPAELRRLYGGDVGFAEECLYANFVSTIDGIVAIPSLPRSNALIADGSEADRFVMGLLRACADVVLVGCGTVRASPAGRWKAGTVFPALTPSFQELRRSLGREGDAPVAIVTGRGSLPPDHPVLEDGAIVLTTRLGASVLRGRLPGAAEIEVVGGTDTVDVAEAVAALHARGYGRILSEAGPRLFSSLATAGLVDELFLTMSPFVAGRPVGEERLSLAEGAGLFPEHRVGRELLSARLHGDHLFLRYATA
jgi:riboflavin biosynthesis pyrimidine reductase